MTASTITNKKKPARPVEKGTSPNTKSFFAWMSERVVAKRLERVRPKSLPYVIVHAAGRPTYTVHGAGGPLHIADGGRWLRKFVPVQQLVELIDLVAEWHEQPGGLFNLAWLSNGTAPCGRPRPSSSRLGCPGCLGPRSHPGRPTRQVNQPDLDGLESPCLTPRSCLPLLVLLHGRNRWQSLHHRPMV